MEDEPGARIDHPERLCEAIIGIIDELEDGEILEGETASELRSEIYRSIDVPEE